MNNFNFNEWKEMQEFPFTYWTGKFLAVFKYMSFLVGVMFFCLYLCDKIDWSLWLVTLPFWYSIPVIIIAMICDGIRTYFRKDKKNTW